MSTTGHVARAFIDPGKFDASVAIVAFAGQLVSAFMVAVPKGPKLVPHRVAHDATLAIRAVIRTRNLGLVHATIERMQHHETTKKYGAHEDILDVQLTGGAVGALLAFEFYATVAYETAFDWKGNIPKPVTKRRVEAVLSDEERKRIVWPCASKKHNVYDAIHGALRTYTARRV